MSFFQGSQAHSPWKSVNSVLPEGTSFSRNVSETELSHTKCTHGTPLPTHAGSPFSLKWRASRWTSELGLIEITLPRGQDTVLPSFCGKWLFQLHFFGGKGGVNWSHPAVRNSYLCLCAQVSFLVVLRWPYEKLGIEPRLTAYKKAKTLSTVLSLPPSLTLLFSLISTASTDMACSERTHAGTH